MVVASKRRGQRSLLLVAVLLSHVCRRVCVVNQVLRAEGGPRLRPDL